MGCDVVNNIIFKGNREESERRARGEESKEERKRKIS
jgi:hypothetical protein